MAKLPYNTKMNTQKIKQPEGGLLQSREWADFLRVEARGVVDIGSENKIFGVINKVPISGEYLYIPRLTFQNDLETKEFTEEVSKKDGKSFFGWIRMDLLNENDLKEIKENLNYKVVKSPHNMQPKENFIIDISLSEEELLKNMKSKTRYNIRLAERKGVKILTSRRKEDLQKFFDLVNKTAERKNVSFHNFEHYEKMFESLPEDCIELYLAEYEGKIIAANIATFYKGVATYLHGGLDGEYRNLMAPFLLQWKMIRDAKKRGCVWYDFGGVFPNSNDGGKKGITRFKMSFSPKTEIFKTMGTYDIIFSPLKYWVYRGLQKTKGMIGR